jgi:predicted ATP-dependent serine protease
MHLEKRIKEAEKMGFKKIFVPEKSGNKNNIEIIEVKNISNITRQINNF